jgi:hypothetical protein
MISALRRSATINLALLWSGLINLETRAIDISPLRGVEEIAASVSSARFFYVRVFSLSQSTLTH